MINKPNFKNSIGCCLDCNKKYDGCLCYDCKCKKCYWYIEDNLIDYNLVDKSCGYKFGDKFKNLLINLVRNYLNNINDIHKWEYEYNRFLLIGLIPDGERV